VGVFRRDKTAAPVAGAARRRWARPEFHARRLLDNNSVDGWSGSVLLVSVGANSDDSYLFCSPAPALCPASCRKHRWRVHARCICQSWPPYEPQDI